MGLMGAVQNAISKGRATQKDPSEMTATDLLRADHDAVEELFKKVEATDSKAEHKRIFKKIHEELTIHAHIEEKIFYPRIKQEEETKDITLEGIEEHHQAKLFLREIPALANGSEKFDPKLKVLMEDIRHHVKEEENTMFPKVERLLGNEELRELAVKMEAEKKRYKKSLKTIAH
jgi:hemerythrin superfamily protein